MPRFAPDTSNKQFFAVVFVTIGTRHTLVADIVDAINPKDNRRATPMVDHRVTTLRTRKGFFQLRGLPVIDHDRSIRFYLFTHRRPCTSHQFLFRLSNQGLLSTMVALPFAANLRAGCKAHEANK